MDRPSVGRIVHYNAGGTVYAAVITSVASRECVNLSVINDASFKLDSSDEPVIMKASIYHGKDGNQWDWPPRIDPIAGKD